MFLWLKQKALTNKVATALKHNVHFERCAFIWGFYVLKSFNLYYFLLSWLVADTGNNISPLFLGTVSTSLRYCNFACAAMQQDLFEELILNSSIKTI